MDSLIIEEAAANDQAGLEELFVIAARFVDGLEAKQREHKSWYQPLENQQEEAFGNAMRDALMMGRVLRIGSCGGGMM